jgi:methionyl-tRNA formyltransferase
MIPIELKGEIYKFPKTDNYDIVVVTGSDLRHKRFAYRMQQEFSDKIVAWFELDKTVKTNANTTEPLNLINRIVEYYKSEKVLNLKKNGFLNYLRILWRLTKNKIQLRNTLLQYERSARNNEEELFLKEINRIKKYAHLSPIKVHPNEINSEIFISKINNINPYFFLTLGGQLYKKPLLNSIRGVALNQHAGHSPDLKGAFTIEWALYKRSLNYVSNTVHITTTGADAGPILRRSNPCIFYKDNIHTIFARSVALGTELMIEVVNDIISKKNIIAYKQPRNSGITYLYKEFSSNVKLSLVRDFKTNWLSKELEQQRNF